MVCCQHVQGNCTLVICQLHLFCGGVAIVAPVAVSIEQKLIGLRVRIGYACSISSVPPCPAAGGQSFETSWQGEPALAGSWHIPQALPGTGGLSADCQTIRYHHHKARRSARRDGPAFAQDLDTNTMEAGGDLDVGPVQDDEKQASTPVSAVIIYPLVSSESPPCFLSFEQQPRASRSHAYSQLKHLQPFCYTSQRKDRRTET